MPVPQQLTDALARIDTATNTVADVVAALRDQVKTQMTQEEVTNFQNSMDGIEARLRGVATDPNNPVPPEPPLFANARSRSKV